MNCSVDDCTDNGPAVAVYVSGNVRWPVCGPHAAAVRQEREFTVRPMSWAGLPRRFHQPERGETT